MKRNTIKSWIITAALSFSMSGMVSCVGDLDVTPIDPSVTMEFDRNKVFTKIYATMGLTGIEEPIHAKETAKNLLRRLPR